MYIYGLWMISMTIKMISEVIPMILPKNCCAVNLYLFRTIGNPQYGRNSSATAQWRWLLLSDDRQIEDQQDHGAAQMSDLR